MEIKSFIITVDTEGDDLWQWKEGKTITTNNSEFIPRFQELCNKFGFKPVWLTNYEMILSDEYVKYIKPVAEKGECEIGIHVHAWNNPPYYDLKGKNAGNPYLIEYPVDIMHAKFKTTYDLIEQRLGVKVKSHRSGRWAMDKRYFQLLEEFGVICDCSYTPGVSWLNAEGKTAKGGCDYRNVPKGAHLVGKILEVPASVRHYNRYLSKDGGIKHQIRTMLKGGAIWLRPALTSLGDMKKLIKDIDAEPGNDYLEFMVHSSELMPGGSPYFKTETDIDKMYDTVENLFSYAQQLGYVGETLESYTNRYLSRH